VDIRDKAQLEKAKLEDTLIELIYGTYKDIVLHGGTAIWRCYAGNRFSRDLDFYFKKGERSESACYKELIEFFKEKGFALKSSNYDNTTKTMHFTVESNIKMNVDINFNYKAGAPSEFTKVDDSKIIVLALNPEVLLDEKIETYYSKLHNKDETRQPEAQDLYDIYYLIGIIPKIKDGTKRELVRLVSDIENKPPLNMPKLSNLVLHGLPPTFELMIKKIKDVAK
jgi:predicted nucleotidyltransferase component of viral defense system